MGIFAAQLSSFQMARFSESGNRMFVPVKPAQTVYAQYRHISGTPASGGQRTVPLSRVQLLNSLISNLQKIKKSTPETSAENNQADMLIQQYARELHQAVKSVPASFGTGSSAGMVFSLSA